MFAMTAIVGNAQKAQIYSTKAGAINGYDAVSYFSESKPVKGDSKFTLKWMDATWYFSTNENLEIFKS